MMKGFILFLLCLIFSTHSGPAQELAGLELSCEQEATFVHWKSRDLPWPKYLPEGYIFQGVSYLNTKHGKVVHLRFTNDEKLLSIFIKPTIHKKRKWQVKRKGEYTMVEWQKGGKDFTIIGRESTASLMKIAESIRLMED